VGLTEGELFRPSCSIMSCPPPGGSLYLLMHSNMLSQILYDKTKDGGKIYVLLSQPYLVKIPTGF
jgi:hypothetical protein